MYKLLTFFSFLILCFTACKKDSTSTNNTSLAANTIEFYVDGVKQTYGNAYATNGLGTFSGSYVLTVGSNQLSPSIQVKAFDSVAIKPKTYYGSSSSGYTYSYTFYGAYQTNQNLSPGYVKVTSLTTSNVQGEFMDSVLDFSTKTWKVLKQGKFNVNF